MVNTGVDLSILTFTAFTIGILHTVLGPDHYLPFVALSKSQGWKWKKTIMITLLCGVGHIAGSMIFGFIGIGLGVGVSELKIIEGIRGNLAAWFLFSFGILYTIWGLKRAYSGKSHSHAHIHADGSLHSHSHQHLESSHKHIHTKQTKNKGITPWLIFIFFVLGPCEALIPLLMYPASYHSIYGLVLVTATFSLATIITMLLIVFFLVRGLEFLPLRKLERYIHVISGGAITLSAGAILFLGL